MRLCTDEDWLKFHKPGKQFIDKVDKFKESKVAFCVDTKDLYGKNHF